MNCAHRRSSARGDGVYPLAKFVRIINVNLIAPSTCCLFAERRHRAADR
jgi:hypothetical protein